MEQVTNQFDRRLTGGMVTLTVIIGDGQLGGSVMKLNGTALDRRGDIVRAPIGDAAGRAIESVRSRGKLLVIRLGKVTDAEPGPRQRSFVVHLMQGGRLSWNAKHRVRPRGGQARWHLRDGSSLLLTESGTEHRVGVWFVAGDPERSAPLAALGPDADTVDAEELAERLEVRSMRLHHFLRDQHGIAGLGRRLADEVCHGARLSPFALTTKLRPDDVERLVATIRDQVAADLAFERAREDMSHAKDRVGSAHRRVGQACPVCGEPLTPGPSTPAGASVERYCRYSGDHEFVYPRDWHPPVRPGTGVGPARGLP